MGSLAVFSLLLDLLQSIANGREMSVLLAMVNAALASEEIPSEPKASHKSAMFCHWLKLACGGGACVILLALILLGLLHGAAPILPVACVEH